MDTGVLTFKNIDDEDFTHQFHGEQITVEAGELKILPAKVANHLAKHLAYKILIKEAQKIEDESIEKGDKNIKTKSVGADEQEALAKTMISEVVQPEKPEEKEKVSVGEEKPEEKEEFEDLPKAKKPVKKPAKKLGKAKTTSRKKK